MKIIIQKRTKVKALNHQKRLWPMQKGHRSPHFHPHHLSSHQTVFLFSFVQRCFLRILSIMPVKSWSWWVFIMTANMVTTLYSQGRNESSWFVLFRVNRILEEDHFVFMSKKWLEWCNGQDNTTVLDLMNNHVNIAKNCEVCGNGIICAGQNILG